MNDGIKLEFCSLSYQSVEEVASMACSLGPHVLVAKMDLKNVYWMALVHAEDRHLLAVTWKGETLVDGALPFGLRSAPKFFTVVESVLVWILWCKGVKRQSAIWTTSPSSSSPSCQDQRSEHSARRCVELEVLVVPHKVEGSCISHKD